MSDACIAMGLKPIAMVVIRVGKIVATGFKPIATRGRLTILAIDFQNLMPQSYSSIWIHLIWSTKNREPILVPDLKHQVYEVINTTAKDHEIYLDCINGVEDHVHLLVRLRTDQSVADVVKTIKGNSWEYFNDDPESYISWQDGFAAFSVSPNQLKQVRKYIYHQEEHHRNKSFSEEMKTIKDIAKSSSL